MFTSIHSRRRRRKMRDGRSVILKRVVLSWRDPRSKRRKQRFYSTRAEAEAARTKLLEAISRGGTAPSRSSLTVGDAIDYWLQAKAPSVRPETVAGYRLYSCHAEPLFPILVSDLTTADIRRWYSGVKSRFTASRAKSYLASALALVAEDHNLRPPPMPTNLGRNGHRRKKAVLTVEQVCELIAFCRHHPRGIYVALPFLTGLRVGEALALLWSEVDLNEGFIRVCRTQALDGSLHETTKTSSSTRVVPIGDFLRAWLREWQGQLPRSPDLTSRVLPAPRGGPLVYYSFYKRV